MDEFRKNIIYNRIPKMIEKNINNRKIMNKQRKEEIAILNMKQKMLIANKCR